MPLPKNIKDVIQRLVLIFESDHFIVHYALRNPQVGRGLGPDGVGDKSLISTYVKALESLYNALTSAPWDRDPPILGVSGKTHVYVFNCGGPFTTYDSKKIPYIVLSSRNNEPTKQGELCRARSEAVHECTHLFNYTQRPLHDLNSRLWDWFDEGMAVQMEMLVASDHPDYFRFLPDWIDSPEMPLDYHACKYQAGMFIDYIRKRLGLQFVNDVWTKSKPEEGPFETIERLMPDGQRFFSADSALKDFFASGYCIDPYCLGDHASEVFLRFGERAVSESLVLPAANDVLVNDSLDHLACRYYRFYVEPQATTFDVRMTTVGDLCNTTPLKGEIAVITSDRRRIILKTLTPVEDQNGPDGLLSCTLQLPHDEDVDHIVLVVSNCGTNLPLNGRLAGNDDNKRFIIKAAADFSTSNYSGEAAGKVN